MVASTESFNSIGKDIFFIKINDDVVISYTSIVGVEEILKSLTPTISYLQNNTVMINFEKDNAADKISILDFNGKILKEYIGINENFEINMSSLPMSIYLLRIKYKNGEYRYEKLLNR